jgi:hypothetical protein
MALSRFDHCMTGERDPGTHSTGSWVDSTASLEVLDEGTISYSYRESNSLFLVVPSVLSYIPLQSSINSVYRNVDNDNHLITYDSVNGFGRLHTGHRGPEGNTTVMRLGGSLHHCHDCLLWEFIPRPR